MAHSEKIKLRAFALFLQFKNFEEIARTIKSEYALPKLSANTVRRWSEEAEAGEAWEDIRKRVALIMRRNVEGATTDMVCEIKTKSQLLAERLYDQLMAENGPKVKSVEGGMYAYKTLAEFVIKLQAHENMNVSPFVIVQTLLEIFNEIPRVRKAIEANWEAITEQVRARIAVVGEPKLIEVTPERVE